MPFEDKPLALITANDVQDLIRAGRKEGSTLEYKSDLYDNTERGNREFLQDVCMFANANGGMILIGVSELRDEAGQPTGIPDAQATIGIEHPNPEQQLLSYESRILEAIDERLPVHMRAVPIADGRHVFAIRIPNSLAKPHRVRYRGQVNFPSRRERQRYEIDAREIKDLAMRTASQTERAEYELKQTLDDPEFTDQSSPVIVIALLPLFFSNFTVDLRRPEIINAVANFQIFPNIRDNSCPEYGVRGLMKSGPNRTVLTLGHNGLLRLKVPVQRSTEGNFVTFYPQSLDIFARQFVVQAAALFEAASLNLPAIFGISLSSRFNLIVIYDELDRTVLEKSIFRFPSIPLTVLGAAADPQLRVLLDHIHQGFGHHGSRSFNTAGEWQNRI